jgi:hypothetical protein
MKSLTPSLFLPLAATASILLATGYALLLRRALSRSETALLTLVLSVSLIVFSTLGLNLYGWTLFVLVPFLIGFISEVLYIRHNPEGSFKKGLLVATAALALAGAGLILFAVEGAICLIMAFPLAFPLTLAGVAVGYSLHRRFWNRRPSPALLLLLPLMAPLLMGAEAAAPRQPPVYRVRTAVEIDAPPEAVWRNVVSFRELPPPDEWLFQTGLAYPVRAEIRGTGVGAVRTCQFSTGPFVEPIEVWDEPRLLRFRVTANPPSLQELSPYGAIHPPHVQGFLVSKQGQFRLVRLPGGRTRLEGTTWYQHGLYPAGYWRLWSDWIIHRIHLRVLEHVKRLSEEKFS